MTAKLDALKKQIQTLEQLMGDRSDSSYQTIQQSLQELGNSLKAQKLVLQIAGSNLEQIQLFQKLLGYGGFPKEQFSVRTSTLSDTIDFEPTSLSPTLVLKSLDFTLQYDLSGDAPLIIGRNPNKAQILLPDRFNLVSGSHAKVQFSADNGWQICDFSSKNGIYVNGASSKLSDWHKLESGDQLCLGSSTAVEGSVTLVFHIPKPIVSSALTAAYQILNCDVLCLVIDLSQPLSHTAQQLLQQASETAIAKLLLVAAMPEGSDPEIAKANLKAIEIWARECLCKGKLEMHPLLLHPIASNPKATVMMPYAQPEFEQLCQTLKALTQDNLEGIILQRGVTQLLIQIAAIEAAFNTQNQSLTDQIRQDEERLKNLAQGNLKEQVIKALNKVGSDKDLLFKQVKSEVVQSKAMLLDEYRRSSLPFEIKRFVKRLKPVVIDRSGRRHVRLQVVEKTQTPDDKVNVYGMATELCRTRLTKWTLEEWHQICTFYGAGGLRGLLQKSYESLNSIGVVPLSASMFQIPQLPDLQPILQASLVEPFCGINYKRLSILGYLFKNIKGQVISGVALFTLIGNAFLGDVISKNLKQYAIAPILIGFTIGLFLTYRQENLAKIEEVTEKLRKEMNDHYQSLSKTLAERLVQHLNFAMESEERRLRETLEAVKEQYAICIGNLEKTQLQLKAQIDDNRRTQQKLISKDIPELHKLKQELASFPNRESANRLDTLKRGDRSFPKRRLEAS